MRALGDYSSCESLRQRVSSVCEGTVQKYKGLYAAYDQQTNHVIKDGARLARGQLPTLIEWGESHPCDTLPASGITLQALALGGVPAALAADWPAGVAIDPGVTLSATLATPLGPRHLSLTGD